MNPVFNEYITFLKNNKVNMPNLKEGYYWLNRQIIKAYDTQGNLQKIARIYIDDKLNITYKIYEHKKEFQIESWQDTIERKKERLYQLSRESADLINNSLEKYKNYIPIILTSGGKDSSVTTYLVRKIINAKCIFGNTTLDCGDTYRYIKTIDNIETIKPDENFYQWIKTNIIPTRFSRGCCRVFKESAMINKLNKNKNYLFFMGIRNEESAQRKDYQNEWKNEKWIDRDWISVLPIRKWTEEDVWLYIFWRNIKFSDKYKKGYARSGCSVACPFYAKSTWVLDKYWYPKTYNRWHDILEKDFKENEKWIRLNCTLEEYHTCWNGGMLRPDPTEEVVQEFADYKNIKFDVAKKFFNNNCFNCTKKIKNNDDIAMNLKFLGGNTRKLFCKKCFKNMYDMNENQWNEYIEGFKREGCELF